MSNKIGAGLGKIQKRVLALVSENSGLNYKNLAQQVYGKADYHSLNKVYSACSSLRKRGYPVYLVEDGGEVKMIETKTDYRKVVNRSSEKLEPFILNFSRLIADTCEKHPDLIPEAKLGVNAISKMLLNLEDKTYRAKLLAPSDANTTDKNN